MMSAGGAFDGAGVGKPAVSSAIRDEGSVALNFAENLAL